MGKDDCASFPGSEAKLLAQRGHRAGNGYARDLDPRRLRDSGDSGLAYTFNNYFVVDFPRDEDRRKLGREQVEAVDACKSD